MSTARIASPKDTSRQFVVERWCPSLRAAYSDQYLYSKFELPLVLWIEKEGTGHGTCSGTALLVTADSARDQYDSIGETKLVYTSRYICPCQGHYIE